MKKDNLYKKALKAINKQDEYVSLMADVYGNNSREYSDELKKWNGMIDVISEIFDKGSCEVIHDAVWMEL